MEIIKDVIELIVAGAKRTDVDAVFGLLMFYLVIIAGLMLIRIFKGVPK